MTPPATSGVLREMARHHGLPLAVYSDRHSIFEQTTPQALTIDAQLRGLQRPPTQVGRALAELDIRWIPAHSPQATDEIVKPTATRGGARGVR